MNNIGIGVDIENTARFKKRKEKQDPFLRKIFSKRELDYCFSKINPALHLAARYAGKEAVIKALNSLCGRETNYLDYKKIEIYNEKNGLPKVNLKRLDSKKILVRISLSHCQDKAIASVVLLRRN